MYYNTAYVIFSYINGSKEEIEVTTTFQYKRFASIRSFEPTILKRQEKFCWTQTQTAKPGNFITSTPFYSVKSKPRADDYFGAELHVWGSKRTDFLLDPYHGSWLLEDDDNGCVGGPAKGFLPCLR